MCNATKSSGQLGMRGRIPGKLLLSSGSGMRLREHALLLPGEGVHPAPAPVGVPGEMQAGRRGGGRTRRVLSWPNVTRTRCVSFQRIPKTALP